MVRLLCASVESVNRLPLIDVCVDDTSCHFTISIGQGKWTAIEVKPFSECIPTTNANHSIDAKGLTTDDVRVAEMGPMVEMRSVG